MFVAKTKLSRRYYSAVIRYEVAIMFASNASLVYITVNVILCCKRNAVNPFGDFLNVGTNVSFLLFESNAVR